MAAIKYRSYQTFLDTMGGLIGWSSYTALPATQVTSLQAYYNSNASEGWISNNWLAVCPNGEARFVGNQGQYPNDLSNTTYWTATGLTPTKNSLANPADGKVSATKCLELVPSTAHNELQSYTYIPSTTYQLTSYWRPIGGRYGYFSANDGVNTYSAFVSPLGVLGTYSTNMTAVPSVSQSANGFWIVNLYFTSASTAGAGNYGPASSSDGSTLTYAGDAAKGFYSWGNVLTQTAYSAPTALLIPNDQLGEDFIDACFQVWQQSPVAQGAAVPQGFQMMPDGVQIIGTNSWIWNGWMWTFPMWYTAGYPVFLYYRKGCPDYSGLAFSTTTSYTVDTQILYNDATNGYDFWKCVVATSANDSPASAPTKWTELQLPEFLFNYVTYSSFADYLRMDAQVEKAQMMDAQAQEYLDNQSYRQELGMGIQPPLRMQTHLNSQGNTWFGQ